MTIRHSNPVEDKSYDLTEEELLEIEFHFVWSQVTSIGIRKLIKYGVKLWLTSMLQRLRSKLVSQRST
jgi:hypothetical protein